MIKAFKSGVSFHDYVAKFCGIPKVAAKTINFGKLFGQSKRASYLEVRRQILNPGDGKEPGVPLTEGEFDDFYDRHTEMLPGMAIHERMVRASIVQRGEVRTYFGARHPVKAMRGHEFRTALNMPVQGTAAGLAKLCMPLVWEAAKRAGAKLCIQCHDEFGIYTPTEVVGPLALKVGDIMRHRVEWPVTIEVEVKVAGNWQDAH
jgi:DNA polymerase-1